MTKQRKTANKRPTIGRERTPVRHLDLNALGETKLIELLTREIVLYPDNVIRGIGDDAAVLKAEGEDWLLFTTDMLIEDVHFSMSYVKPVQVGAKALVASVSDIAAMGGRPLHAVVSLGIPLKFPVEVLKGVYSGLRSAAQEYALNIVGGDTVKSPGKLIINVALIGAVGAGKAVYRSGAKPGDLVFVTGSLGNSAAGLFLCQNPGISISMEASSFLKSAHTDPKAQVKLGALLAGTGKVTSMDDISDGLATEIHEICLASGVGCRIRSPLVPQDQRMKEAAAAANRDPLSWALYGGEDFELVFTVRSGSAAAIKRLLNEEGAKCHLVGEIVQPKAGITMELPQGYCVPLEAKGYDHFKAGND